MNHDKKDEYVLVTTYAELTPDEESCLEDDEFPTEILAVEKSFLQVFARTHGYGSLKDFLDSYIYDTLIDLRNAAEQAKALAFAFSEDLGNRYYFPKKMSLGMAKALMKFVNSERR